MKTTLAAVAMLAVLARAEAAQPRARRRSPPRHAIWNELADAGVDHLNPDDLAGRQQFLTMGMD